MDMKDKPRIGFVILVWNSENVIQKCLQSLADLKEISPLAVIVDNGSTDRSREIVNAYAAKYPDIFSLLPYDRNMGTTISRNAGLKRLMPSRPDYYGFLDSDTEVSDAALVTLVEEMNAHPRYGVIGPTMVSSDGVVQVSARSFPTAQEKLCKALPIPSLQVRGERLERQAPPTPDAVSYPVDYLMSACWLIRPDTLEAAGLLDEKIFYAPEDAEYCIRVWKSGYQAAFCPPARILHEWQRLSKQRFFSKINWEHVKGLAYMFRKHRYLFSTNRLKDSFAK